MPVYSLVYDDQTPTGKVYWINHTGPWIAQGADNYSTTVSIPDMVDGTGALALFYIDTKGTGSSFDNDLSPSLWTKTLLGVDIERFILQLAPLYRSIAL